VDSLLNVVLDFFQPLAEIDRQEGGDESCGLLEWEQIVCCLQAHGDQLERMGVSHLKVVLHRLSHCSWT
jgi:hypothetical protein